MSAPAKPRNLHGVEEIEQRGLADQQARKREGHGLDAGILQRLVQIAAPAMAAQTADEPLDAA
jgi:hypothetical protein